MTIQSTVIALSSVATKIIDAATTWANLAAAQTEAPVYLYATNMSSAINVFVGGSGLTTANGGALIPPTNIGVAGVFPAPSVFVLYPGDALFAISLSGTPNLSVMANQQSVVKT